MKSKLLTLLLISSFASLYAINNSIVFYSTSGVNCEYIFRDTAGTRTYTPTSFSWDFGDGNYSSTQHAVHDYTVNGSYIVKHYCSDGVNFDTAVITVAVGCNANNPLYSYFYIENRDTLNPTAVKFRSFIQGRPTGFIWDFGDGNISYDLNPTHAYNSTIPITYTICFKIWDNTDTSEYCQNYLYDPNFICKNTKANFTWFNDTSCNRIKFFSLSGRNVTNVSWNFGDGNTTSNFDPVYSYSSTIQQTYTVSLKVWDTIGCSDSISMQVTPKCRNCYSVIANIQLQTDSLNPGKAILYNNSTGPISSHNWDFGDGSTSTLSSPNHTYTSSGQITLRYIATDTFNCSDTAYLYFEIDTNGHIKRGNINFTLQIINNTQYTSIDQVNTGQHSLLVYPQPGNTSITIECTDINVKSFTVFNAQGQKVATLHTDFNSKTELDTSTWENGLYLISDNLGRTIKLFILH